MKKTFSQIAFFCALAAFFSCASRVLAQDATSSADASSSTQIVLEKNAATEHDNNSATQILDNLDRLAKNTDQSEQIKEQYDGVSDKNRGFIAQVTSIKDNAFKITTPKEEELFITVDKSTTIVKKGKTTTGENIDLLDWINIDDWLVLIGVQSNDTFSARRIIVSSESLLPEETFVLRAKIKTATSKKVDAQIIGTDTIETLNFNKTTNLVDSLNETITYKDLQIDMEVFLIGTIENDKKNLQTLRLLSQTWYNTDYCFVKLL